MKNKSIQEFIEHEKFIKPSADRGDEIILYQRREVPQAETSFFSVVEVKIYQSRRSYLLTKSLY
jgi:hypothetical protein